jgi:hypothetical protein
MFDVSGVGLGFVEEECQPRGVFEDNPAGQFVLDVAVSLFKEMEGALLLLSFADDADVNAAFAQVGSDVSGGNGDEPAIGKVHLLHDLTDLLFD